MDKKNIYQNKAGLFGLLVPIVYIVVAALLLFVPGVDTSVFAIILGACLIVFGAAMIIQYFSSKAYMETFSYGFAFGLFSVFLGVVTIIRAKEIGAVLTTALAICILLTVTMKIQYAVQLKFWSSIAWIPVLVISVLFLICAALIFINPFGSTETCNLFTYIVLMCDGVVNFIVSIILQILQKKNPRNTEVQDIVSSDQ